MWPWAKWTGCPVEVVRTGPPADAADFTVITLRGALPDGTEVSVAGTLAGVKQVEKIVSIDGFDLDITAAGNLALFRYSDRPGIVGAIGAMLGDAGVNIAGAQVSRTSEGGDALMALTVDQPIPADILAEITEVIGATSGRTVSLD